MALNNSNIFPMQENVYDNLQWLMSGPGGLGQNFSGVSSYTPAYLTGTFRQPFTVPTTVAVAPTWYGTANIGNITVQGPQNITVEFATPAANPPFAAGDTVNIAGVTDSYPTTGNTYYDGTYVSGVTGCTVSNVSLQTAGSYDWPTYVSGGTITKNYSSYQINVGNISVVSNNTIVATFSTAQVVAPFETGQTVQLIDVLPTDYNKTFDVNACSTSDVTLDYSAGYAWPAYISGGKAVLTPVNLVSTDANARVTVYGPTDRVFISAQTNLDFSYTASMASEFNIAVQINRYQGFIDRTDPNNLDYAFNFDGLISEQVFNFTPTGSGSDSIPEVIFTSIIDSPNFGYYWYILELQFQFVSGDVKPETFTVGLRGLTAQVVKQ